MEKSQRFSRVRFTVEDIKAAYAVFEGVIADHLNRIGKPERVADATSYQSMEVSAGPSAWKHDNVSEFFADLDKPHDDAFVNFEVTGVAAIEYRVAPTVEIRDFGSYGDYVKVIVRAEDRATVEQLMRPFAEAAKIRERPIPAEPTPEPEPAARPRVFIGHGGASTQWRDLKDHLQDHHGYDVEAFQTGARSGHTIRDILEDMLSVSTFAILVMTGEDAQGDGSMRARQNVVHEAGLFQGRLGFARAIILLEEGVENFSNVDGVQYIGFTRNNIRETFGDVLATLKREFPDAV